MSAVSTFTYQTIFTGFAKRNTTIDKKYFLKSWNILPSIRWYTIDSSLTKNWFNVWSFTSYFHPSIRYKFYGISKRNVIKRIFSIPQFTTAATIQLYTSHSKPQNVQNCSL